jgi:hypothetical protein
MEVNKRSLWDDFERNLVTDLENSKCKQYSERTFADLRQPEYPSSNYSSCYYIYFARQDSRFRDEIPFTLSTYYKGQASQKWDAFLDDAKAFWISGLALSALIYFSGWVVAWIRRGFAGQA